MSTYGPSTELFIVGKYKRFEPANVTYLGMVRQLGRTVEEVRALVQHNNTSRVTYSVAPIWINWTVCYGCKCPSAACSRRITMTDEQMIKRHTLLADDLSNI